MKLYLIASACDVQVRLTVPSVCLFAGTLVDILPARLVWAIGCSLGLSDGPARRTSSNAGGGVEDDEEDDGRLRDSPSSLLALGRNDTVWDKEWHIKIILKNQRTQWSSNANSYMQRSYFVQRHWTDKIKFEKTYQRKTNQTKRENWKHHNKLLKRDRWLTENARHNKNQRRKYVNHTLANDK